MRCVYFPTRSDSSNDIETTARLVDELALPVQCGFMPLLGSDLQTPRWPGHDTHPFIVMASNEPVERLNPLTHATEYTDYMRRVIDFTASLPHSGRTAAVSIHLNTLLPGDDWSVDYSSCARLFERKVLPVVEQLVSTARNAGVDLVVETTPVPEFGDRGGDWAGYGNPFPLYSARGFEEVRATGAGIALDLCHTYTLYAAARAFDGSAAFFDTYKGIFPEDIDYLRTHSLLDEVAALQPGDVVHLNDSRGLYDPRAGTLHEEGVALGQGDIAELPEIVHALAGSDLRIVFEVNETDYTTRPNLRASVAYFMNHV